MLDRNSSAFKLAEQVCSELKTLYNKKNRNQKDEDHIELLKESLDEICDSDSSGEIRAWVDSSPDKIIRESLDDDDSIRSYDKQTSTIAGACSDRSFRGMFGKSLSKDGWKNKAEFIEAIDSGLADKRLQRALQTGIPSDGGFLCPSEFASEIFDNSLENEIIRKYATVFPVVKGNSKKVPATVLGVHSSNLFGGTVGYWTEEATNITPSSPKFRLLELTCKKLAIFTKSSNELLSDGISTDEQISTLITKALGWFLDWQFIQGDGAGTPEGILNSSALITIPRETGQVGGTIVFQNVVRMFASMYPSGFAKSIWLASQTTLPQLLALSLPIGTGGERVAILKEVNGSYTLLGRPLIFSEKLKSLGEKGDLIFADLSQYFIALKSDLRLDKSGHLYFQSDETAYRCIIRADGQSSWNETLTLADGSEVSPFIVLATRT